MSPEQSLTYVFLASGLYYLSELVEEHTVLAKKLLYRLIIGVIVLQVLLLLVDGFPVGLSALSVVSHGIYAQNLRRFPIVKLTDPLFLVSCGMYTFQFIGDGHVVEVGRITWEDCGLVPLKKTKRDRWRSI
jgi:hypothetical protein